MSEASSSSFGRQVTLSDIAKIDHSRMDPSETPEKMFSLYSFKGYDEGEKPVDSPGKDIGSAKYIVKSPCILLSKLNPRIKRVWKVESSAKNPICSTEFVVLCPREEIPLDYLYTICNSPPFRNYLKSLVTGTSSSHQRVKQSDIKSYEFYCHDILTQHEIGDSYSKLDELVNVNKNIDSKLNQVATTLFKERFRPVVDYLLEGKECPNNYELMKFGEVSQNFDNERDPLSRTERQERQGEYPYYGATGVLDFIDDFKFDGKYLLVAEDGTVETDDGFPVIQFLNKAFWPSNHVHILRGDADEGVTTEFLRWALSFVKISPYITGSVQPKLSQTNLNSIEIPVPPKQEIKNFTELVRPIHELIWHNEQENDRVEAMEKLLLPQLLKKDSVITQ